MAFSANSLFGRSLLCAFFALAAAPVHAQGAASQGVWSKVGETTTERTEVGVATLNGKIYVVGGEAFGRQDSPLFQEFDPATGRWRDLAPMPKGASHVGVAAMNGKLYAAGGFTANVHKNPLDQFVEYDITTNRWRELPPLASPLGSVGLAALAGQIHVIGGRGADGITVGTHQIYDPKTNKWTVGAPLPVARDHLGILVVDGWIHVFGDRTGATVDNVGLHDIYDPSTNVWHTLAPMPTPRSSGAAAYYRGLILYHGGECKDAVKRITFDEFEAYDPKTDSWKALAKAPTGLHAQGAAAVGNSAYFFGGSAGCGADNPSKAVYAFKLP
jgi:N-acetylneuraminic acid mutarotase